MSSITPDDLEAKTPSITVNESTTTSASPAALAVAQARVRHSQLCKIPAGAIYDPHNYLDLIESLGHTCVTQDQDLLFQLAKALSHDVAAWESSDEKQTPSLIQRYIELILSTRRELSEDPDLDQRLVTAASNAISILSYAYICGLTEFHLSEVADFSHCHISYANFNSSYLSGCNFDHADLAQASFYLANLRGAHFRHTNLRNATSCCLDAPVDGFSWLAVRISHDEKWIAVIASDRGRRYAVEIRDAQMLDLVRELNHVIDHGEPHFDLEISSDSQMLAVSNQSPMVTVWEVATGESRFQLGPHPHDVYTVAFHPSGNYIATGTTHGTVHLWDLGSNTQPTCEWMSVASDETGSSPNTLVTKVAFSSDGSLLAELSSMRDIRIREVATGQITLSLESRFPSMYGKHCNLAFSSDSRYLAVQAGVIVQVHDLRQPHPPVLRRGIRRFRHLLQSSELGEDSRDIDSGESLITQFDRLGLNFWKFVIYLGDFRGFFADGRRGVVLQGGIREVGTEAWQHNLNQHVVSKRRPDVLVRVDESPSSLSPDGSCLVLLGENVGQVDGRIQPIVTRVLLLDSQTLTCFATVSCPGRIHRATWTADGASVLLSTEGVIYVLDISSCTIVHVIASADRYSSVRESLARLSRSELRLVPEDQLRLTSIELTTAPRPAPFKNNSGCIAVMQAINGRPSGIAIISLKDIGAPIVRTIALPETENCNGSSSRVATPAAFQLSDNAQYLGVVSNWGDVYVWDLASEGNTPAFRAAITRAPFCGEGRHHQIVFSPDNGYVATKGETSYVWVWDLQARTLKLKFGTSECCFTTVFWSSDGRLLVTHGMQDWIRFWDSETGACVGCLPQIGSPTGVLCSPSMRELIVCRDTGHPLIQRWRVEVLRRKQPQDRPEDNWRIRARLQKVKYLWPTLGMLDADYEGAELTPSYLRCVDMCVERDLRRGPESIYWEVSDEGRPRDTETRLRMLAQYWRSYNEAVIDRHDEEFVEL